MKAEILMVPLTEAGILRISPETAVEAFALHHWWSNYNSGDYSSILDCSAAIPAQPQPPAGETND